MPTGVDELKGWMNLFGDACHVVNVYLMNSPRYFLWTHYETILEVSDKTFFRISFEANDGFNVQHYITFASASS